MNDLFADTRAPRAPASLPTPTDDELRVVAVKRVKAKRDFRNHLFVYLVVNVGLWTLWLIDGAANDWQFPWPVLPTFFWGIFVVAQWYEVYRRDRCERTSSRRRSCSSAPRRRSAGSIPSTPATTTLADASTDRPVGSNGSRPPGPGGGDRPRAGSPHNTGIRSRLAPESRTGRLVGATYDRRMERPTSDAAGQCC